MNNIKWIHKNYNYVTTNYLIYCPIFHPYHKFLPVLIRYPVHIRKIVQKVTSLQILFRLYHLEERCTSTAIRIKSVLKYSLQLEKKSDIQFVTLRTVYNVNMV